MGDDRPSSLDEYLERIRLAEDAWDSNHSHPVGRIRDVFFADISDDDLDEFREELKDLTTDEEFRGQFSPWVVRELVEDLQQDFRAATASDGQPIVVIVELPNGQRFGDVFERPETTDDGFFKFCDALGIDVMRIDELDSNVFTGSVVPVAQEGVSWRIDIDEMR